MQHCPAWFSIAQRGNAKDSIGDARLLSGQLVLSISITHISSLNTLLAALKQYNQLISFVKRLYGMVYLTTQAIACGINVAPIVPKIGVPIYGEYSDS